MIRFTTQMILIGAALILSAADALALPKCPDDQKYYQWSNCEGANTDFNGAGYVGEWKDGMEDGWGTITRFDYLTKTLTGDTYFGEFKKNSPDGQGTRVFSANGGWAGDKYVGGFKDGKYDGKGTYTYANGDKYVGEWKDGNKHGQGTFTYANGDVTEGVWEKDKFKYETIAPPPLTSEAAPKDNAILEASSGSGFAVSTDGYVITNNHVIEGCQQVALQDSGSVVPMIVVTYDLQNDLALLKGDFTPKVVMALSDYQPQLLQDVYAAGYPFGTEISSSIKVTKGIISSLTGIGNNFSNIQIDAALQPGNSGGPILDDKGNVIGVSVAKLDAKYMLDNYGTIPENTNFGIKASVVKSVLDSNGISGATAGTSEISKLELGNEIEGGTYYISCWMTMAQIEQLRTKKVMFDHLK